MKISKGKPDMKNILIFIALTLSLLTLAACGGGGDSQTPATSAKNINFVSDGNGTLTGVVSQKVNQGANSTAVIAVPSSGYHFVNWTEGGVVVLTDPDVYVSKVTTDHTLTANFAKDSTLAKLTINMTGTLPTTTAISGAAFTLTLPANVTPAMTAGTVATGVVSLSGTFSGSTISPQVVYTPATASVPGTLQVTLASSVPVGVTQVGEVATITLQLANGAAPTVGSFGLSAINAIDATLYNTIIGMGVSIANVTLQ